MVLMQRGALFASFVLSCLVPSAHSAAIKTLTMNHTYSISMETAAQVCVGLSQDEGDNYYTIGGDGHQFPSSSTADSYWLEELYPNYEIQDLDVSNFVSTCLEKVPRLIRYSSSKQQDLLPQLISLSIALQAVPIAIEDDVLAEHASVVFDATETWSGLSPAQSVDFILDDNKLSSSFVKDKLVKTNPGYKYPDKRHPLNYTLTFDYQYGIVDFAVKEKIFTFFLPTGKSVQGAARSKATS